MIFYPSRCMITAWYPNKKDRPQDSRSGEQKNSGRVKTLAGLYQGAGTAGADMQTLQFSLMEHLLLLDVGLPLPVGSLF